MTASIPSIQVLIATHEERHAPLAALAHATRECNWCGTEYEGRKGVGGSNARPGDLVKFPFDEKTYTGVRAENSHWMHGAFCSEKCYDEAYYEPPTPGVNW